MVIGKRRKLGFTSYQIDGQIKRYKDAAENTKLVPFNEIASLEKKFQLQRKHNLLKEVLIKVDQICREGNVKYSLADGTLLGAVRHHEFIPWDDDADIMMTRTEYEKFKDLIKERKDVVLFKILFLDRVATSKSFENGIFIDLFVIDELPSNIVKCYWNIAISKLLRLSFFDTDTLKKIKDTKRGIKKWVYIAGYRMTLLIGGFERLLLGKKIYRIHERMAAKSYQKSEYMTKYTSNWRELHRIFKKQWFESYEDIEMNGYNFMSISMAEDFCANMFGNYNELPPENSRIPFDEHSLKISDRPDYQVRF